MFFWNKNKDKTSDINKEPEFVLLKTVNNDYELVVVKGILDNNKIPYLVNDTSMGGYMRIRTGIMLESADIVVNKSDLNRAKELIEGILEGEEQQKEN